MLDLLPSPLLEDFIRGRWLPFVGAGFSSNAYIPTGDPMPTWEGIANGLRSDLRVELEDALDVISAYDRQYGRAALTERLHALLHTAEAIPGEAHEEFCGLPFDRVCTTNWDSLLEKQYMSDRNPCFPLVSEQLLTTRPAADQVVLVKLHGDLEHEYVATHADYDGYFEQRPLFATYFAAMLLQRTPVLIGYGLRDYNVQSVMRFIANRVGSYARRAYALVVRPTKAEVEWFALHGVTVVDLPGPEPGRSLAELFRHLRETWESHMLTTARLPQGELAPELTLPPPHRGRLCYVSVPSSAAAWYERNVFPIVRLNGYLPVARSSVMLSPKSARAVDAALMKRCGMAIVEVPEDRSGHAVVEAVARHVGRRRLVLVTREGGAERLREEGYEHVLVRERRGRATPDEARQQRVAFQHALHQEVGSLPPMNIDLTQVVAQGGKVTVIVAAIGLLHTTIGRAVRRHVVIGVDQGLGRDELLELAVREAVVTREEAARAEELLALVGEVFDGQPASADADEIVQEVDALCRRIEERSES